MSDKRDVLKRSETIDAWNNDKRWHDYFCCPNCRDVLGKEENYLRCNNGACCNMTYYTMEGVEIESKL